MPVTASAAWDGLEAQLLSLGIDATMPDRAENRLFASETALMFNQNGHGFFKVWDQDRHWWH